MINLRQAGDFLAALHRRFLQAQTRLEDKIKELDEVKQRLNLEIRGLEQKKRPYREEVLRLKTLLEERLARLNHLLGGVMQAQDERDLRTHATAITQSCMSYHNLVARQITKDRYETPYIGSQAIVRQLEIKREKLAQTEAALRILNGEREELLGWVENLADRRTLYDGFAGQLDLPILIHRLEEERNGLQDKLDHLDLSEVDRLKAEYDIWRQREDVLVEQGRNSAPIALSSGHALMIRRQPAIS